MERRAARFVARESVRYASRRLRLRTYSRVSTVAARWLQFAVSSSARMRRVDRTHHRFGQHCCWFSVVQVACCCVVALSATAAASAQAGGIVQVDVRDFGAVGDGLTDDVAAVERALAVLQKQGAGTLFFPLGQYALSRALLVRGYGISLRGAGMHPPAACGFGSSLLSQTSNSTLIVFEDCTSCGIQHMALSHAAANTTTAGVQHANPTHMQDQYVHST